MTCDEEKRKFVSFLSLLDKPGGLAVLLEESGLEDVSPLALGEGNERGEKEKMSG